MPRSGATSSRSPIGGEFHSHAGFVPHDDDRRPDGRVGRAIHTGRRVHGAAADARGLRDRDAARRPGHLSQGPRSDLHARRHRARDARVRDRHRVGCAVDDDAALGGDDRRLRGPRGLRQPRPGQRARVPRRAGARALRRAHRRQLRRHRSLARSVRPRRARPSRAVAGGAARRSRCCDRAACSSPTRRRSRRRPRPASS